MPNLVAPSGNTAWDQGINTLAGSLFPDPLHQAQAGYYGAEQRNATIKGDQALDQNAAANAGLTRTPGSGVAPAPFSFHRQPSGMVVMDQPNTLPMTVAPGPPGQATPATPPAQGMPPPPQTVPPQALARIIAPGDDPNPHGAVSSGPLPPQGPPTQEAPAAPNTTTTDGNVPPINHGAGPIHPGSIQDPNGGQKMAAPAAHDGSPATPAFNPAVYIAMMARAGYDASQVQNMMKGYLASAVSQGLIDTPTWKAMDAELGSGTMYSQDAATQRTNVEQAGATQRTAMAETGAKERTLITEGGAMGRLQVQEGAASQRQADTPFTVGGGPNSGGVVTTQGQVRPGQPSAGAPAYNPQVEQLNAQPIEVYQMGPDGKPDTTKPPLPMHYGDAIAQHKTVTPGSMEHLRATAALPTIMGPGQGTAPSKFQSVQTETTMPTALTPTESQTLGVMQKQHVADTYAPMEANPIQGRYKNTDPAALTPEAEQNITYRASQLMMQDPVLRGNPNLAIQRATEEARTNGNLPTNQDIESRRLQVSNVWQNPNVRNQVVKGQIKGHFMIPWIPTQQQQQPNQQQQPQQPNQPQSPMQPAQPNQQAPIARAQPGTPDGNIARGANGQVIGIVRGGLIYPP